MNEDTFDQQYRELFEFASDGYLLTDLAGVIHKANRAAATMLNMQPSDLVGKPLFIFVAQAEHKRVSSHLRQLLGKDDQSSCLQLLDLEITLQPFGQVPFPTAVTFNLTYDATGESTGLLCLLRAISDYKRSEEALGTSERKFRNIFEQSGDGIALTDEHGIIVEWNQAEERITGLKRAEVLGRPLWDAQIQVAIDERRTQATYEQLKDRYHELFETGQSQWLNGLWETDIQRADGTRRIVQASVFLVKTDKGFIAGSISRDITESKQTEEALKRQVEQLASLNKASQAITAALGIDQVLTKIVSLVREVIGADYVGVALVDEEGKFNQSTENLTGVPSLIYRIRPKGFTNWIIRSRQPVVVDSIETDGTVNPKPASDAPLMANPIIVEVGIKSFASLLVAIQNRPLGVLHVYSLRPGTFHDQLPLLSTFANQIAIAIENARMYSQLESRERFITRIVESIPSSVMVIDRSLRVVSVNRNFLEKAQRKARTTLGRKVEKVFPQVLMEYTHLDQKAQQVFSTGQTIEGGKVAYRAPGLPTRIYYYRLIPLKTELAVENVMLLMDDITEREQLGEEVRQAERHLASVVECANDLVISMEPGGQIVTWNWAAESISKLKAEQVREQPLLSLCAPEQRPVMAEILKRLTRGEDVQNTEVNLLTATGEEIPIAWNCSSMRDDAGKVVGIVAVGRDLTEQRRLEEQLIHTAKMASLGVMAGGIAHELRNPLGIISASAQLLLESPEDDQLRSQGLQKIHAATQRASLIIENLLKFSRPEGKRVKKEFDLCVALDESLAMLAHQMTLQKVTLHRQYQPDLPHVYGSREMLQQVFTNLTLNACNAMPEGGTLTIDAQSATTGEVEIRFSDIGRGIAPEHLLKIFDPFFTTMPVGKGVGLGLSISHSIVQQFQGTIEVTSQVDKGSTFIVRLPGIDRS